MFIITRFGYYTAQTLLAVILFSFNINCYAENFIDISKITSLTNITSFSKIKQLPPDIDINPLENKFPEYYEGIYADSINISYTTEILWGKIDFVNYSDKIISKKFFWDSTISGYVNFYFKGQKTSTGSSIPLGKRPNKSLFPSINLTLNPGDAETLYFSRQSHHAMNTKFYIADELEFYKFSTSKENTYRYYAGAILGLVVYNFMLVIFFRNKKYLIYCIFATSFLIAVLNLHGVMDYIDIFENTTFSHYLIISSIMTLFWALYFAFLFLDSKIYLKEFNKFKNALLLIVLSPLIFIPTSVYDHYASYFGWVIDALIVIGLIFLIISCLTAIKRGSPLAKVYLFSWSFVFTGAAVYYGALFGYLPRNIISENGFLLGSIMEMIVLSLGLAYQVAIIDKNNTEQLIKEEGKEKYQTLLRTISHDISNSLQVLVIGAKRLKKMSTDKKINMIAEKIEHSTYNVVEILEQIKTQEKLLQDKESMILSRVNLLEVLNDNIYIFEDALLRKNIIVKIDIPQNSQNILGDRVCLKNNVFGNVISNSIKFSPENSEIIIKASEEGDKVVLEIRDFGGGFSEEALMYINDDYNMTFSTPGTKGETGTGFGLRIIKSYTKMFKGTIEAYNDNGAVFIFKFLKDL